MNYTDIVLKKFEKIFYFKVIKNKHYKKVIPMNELIDETLIGITIVNLHNGNIYMEYVDDNIGGYFRLPFSNEIDNIGETNLRKVKVNSTLRYLGVGEEEIIKRHDEYVFVKFDNITDGLYPFGTKSFFTNIYWKNRNIVEGKMISASSCKIIEVMIKENLIKNE